MLMSIISHHNSEIVLSYFSCDELLRFLCGSRIGMGDFMVLFLLYCVLFFSQSAKHINLSNNFRLIKVDSFSLA